MKNSQELERMKNEDVMKYLATRKSIDEFRASDLKTKISMATRASMDSLKLQNKNTNDMTRKLTNEITSMLESNGRMSSNSLNSIVAGLELSELEKRKITTQVKEKLNTIKEINTSV